MQHTALVTGATGFVGSHLVSKLLEASWQVAVVVRPGSDVQSLQAKNRAIIVHVHDGTTEGMLAIMGEARPTVVFHLASLFLSEHQTKDVVSLVQSNVLYGTQVVEAMARHGVRFLVNTGTSWQHYENREYSPVNLYAATKQAFEDVLQYYVEACGLRVITLSLFDTYGPDDPRPKLMNLLKRVASENLPLAMSPGGQCIDLVHVVDVVRAFMVAAERLLTGQVEEHERYTVSSGEVLQLRELVDRIEKMLGRELPITWGGVPYRRREVMVPCSGPALIGWAHEITLANELQEIFRSC